MHCHDQGQVLASVVLTGSRFSHWSRGGLGAEGVVLLF
jgi:hypothetical protein